MFTIMNNLLFATVIVGLICLFAGFLAGLLIASVSNQKPIDPDTGDRKRLFDDLRKRMKSGLLSGQSHALYRQIYDLMDAYDRSQV
jgi:hypothetical protein